MRSRKVTMKATRVKIGRGLRTSRMSKLWTRFLAITFELGPGF